jgi:urease accessory protein
MTTDILTNTRMGMAIAMTEPVSLSALYRLLTFLSPAFPIGAFTYSHGLEKVIEEDGVTNAVELKDWLEEILRFGAGRSDAILLKESYRAAMSGETEKVQELRQLGLTLQPSRERHLETSAQGTAFCDAVSKSWMPLQDAPASNLFQKLVAADRDAWPYPVALGIVCAAHEIPEDAALTAFLHAFSANIISVAVRAVPLGQSNGQKVLAQLEPVISEIAGEASEAGLDDLGTSTFLADIASMAHETQYSRLFRS